MGRALMTLIDWDQPEYLDLPGLTMAVFQSGSPQKDRPSVVLCHGFPEIGYSWRLIVPPLVDAGFHVIVPDQRGFGYTGLAKNDARDAGSVPLYDMQHLCGDLAAMLDALDIDQAVFAGHDWGGLVTWALPFYHPSRLAGLIGVNTPFIPRLTQEPVEAFRQAMGDDFYIVAFQEHGRAEAVMDGDTARALRCFYRGPAPEQTEAVPEMGPGWENFAILKILETEEAGWPGKQLLHPADFDHYHRAFTRSGFRGGINWYRNFSRNWENSAD
ncbi:MAG: alpha/beta hydrolase, partial [Pseudomonadota bacterium]|nr:alpha/beta hydrolase [Pseudomonadota bacterium]